MTQTLPILGVDTIKLAGVTPPGQWILQSTALVFSWQVNKAFLVDGATVKNIGNELMEPSFLIKLWDVDPLSKSNQYQAFRAFAAQFLRTPVYTGGKGQLVTAAIGIVHPELNRLGCASVVVKRSPVLTNNGKGLWSGVAEFLQYREPKAALLSPQVSIPGLANGQPAAKDALQQQIQDKLARRAAARGAK